MVSCHPFGAELLLIYLQQASKSVAPKLYKVNRGIQFLLNRDVLVDSTVLKLVDHWELHEEESVKSVLKLFRRVTDIDVLGALRVIYLFIFLSEKGQLTNDFRNSVQTSVITDAHNDK